MWCHPIRTTHPFKRQREQVVYRHIIINCCHLRCKQKSYHRNGRNLKKPYPHVTTIHNWPRISSTKPPIAVISDESRFSKLISRSVLKSKEYAISRHPHSTRRCAPLRLALLNVKAPRNGHLYGSECSLLDATSLTINVGSGYFERRWTYTTSPSTFPFLMFGSIGSTMHS